MKTEELILYGALGYLAYVVVTALQQPAQPPLPTATLFDSVTGLPVPEPAGLVSTIPLLRGPAN